MSGKAQAQQAVAAEAQEGAASSRPFAAPRSAAPALPVQQTSSLGHPLRPARPVAQPMLRLGPADDRFEQEADRVAAQVLRGRRVPAAQPRSATVVQRAASAPAAMSAMPAQVEAGIAAARGGGQILPAGVRGPLEAAMGADFAGVRVHSDARADALSRAIQARAFATGRDLFFARGEYAPASESGRALLAHELAHVAQQATQPQAGSVVQRKPKNKGQQSGGNNQQQAAARRFTVVYGQGVQAYIQDYFPEIQNKVATVIQEITSSKVTDKYTGDGPYDGGYYHAKLGRIKGDMKALFFYYNGDQAVIYDIAEKTGKGNEYRGFLTKTRWS